MSMQKVLQYKNSWRLLEKAVLIEKAEKCILMKTQVYII